MRAALAGLALTLFALAAFDAFGRGGARRGAAVAAAPPGAAPAAVARTEGLSPPPLPEHPVQALRAVPAEREPPRKAPPAVSRAAARATALGSIRGRLEHGLSGPPRNVRVVATSRGGDRKERRVGLGPQSGILLERLAPGLYDVAVTLDQAPLPLLRLAGVEVLGGLPTEPPELNPLDLRARVRPVAVRVTDAAGKSIPATILHRPADAPEHPWSACTNAWKLPPSYLLTEAAALDVRASAPGFRTAQVRCERSEVTLALSPGLPVVLRASQALDLGKRGITATLRPRDDPERLGQRPARSVFAKDGTCRLIAGAPGTYDLTLHLAAFHHSAPLIKSIPVEVRESATDQTCWIELTNADLDAAFDRGNRAAADQAAAMAAGRKKRAVRGR